MFLMLFLSFSNLYLQNRLRFLVAHHSDTLSID